MSDTNQDKTARTPRLTIDQNAMPAGESADTKPEAGEQHDSAANDFDEAMWDTLVIAFFVLIGAVIGQIRDGENGIVNFFGRLFSGR